MGDPTKRHANACSGPLPASLATLNELVVLDLHGNALSGTLAEFAFQTQANRQDLHSALRYLDLSNNTLSGACCRLPAQSSQTHSLCIGGPSGHNTGRADARAEGIADRERKEGMQALPLPSGSMFFQ